MDMNVGQLIVWIIVGMLAGTLAGRLIHNRRRGYGLLMNTAIGMVGAIIGGLIFQALDIGPWFPDIQITLDDIIAAFVGALLLLAVLWFIRRV